MDWKDITIDTYNELTTYYDDKETFIDRAMSLLYGVTDPQQLTVAVYQKYLSDMKFLGRDIKPCKLSDSYTINGRKYELDMTLNDFTIAQLTDFENYKRQKPMDLVNIMSVVLIPTGHKYNDGYDMQRAKRDIGSLDIETGMAVFHFFADWCSRYVTFLERYLLHRLKRMKKDERTEKLRELVHQLRELSTYFRMS